MKYMIIESEKFFCATKKNCDELDECKNEIDIDVELLKEKFSD